MMIWSEVLLRLAVILLSLAFLANVCRLVYRVPLLAVTGTIGTRAALASLTASLALRAVAQSHFPVTTHYETLAVILWVALAVFTYLERRLQWSMLNAVFLGLASSVLIYSLTLARQIEPVLPILQKPWVAFHVTLNVAAYGLFAVSFVLGILYLIQEYQLKQKRITFLYYLLPPLDRLEFLGELLLRWGFPLLTAGMISGAIYAQAVWGSFWDWNAKEVTTLVAWLIYATYFYLRHARGWRGRTSVLWSVFGFLAVLANYGVSLWVRNPHSFMQQFFH